jgi:predicted transcriptional regulator
LTRIRFMPHTYGMSIMAHRTSFALDEATIQRLKKLSEIWGVSQAEVVRRAIEKAEVIAEEGITSRIDRLRSYQDQGGIAAETAEAYLREVKTVRAESRRKE